MGRIAPYARMGRAQVAPRGRAARDHARPRVGPSTTQNSGPTGISGGPPARVGCAPSPRRPCRSRAGVRPCRGARAPSRGAGQVEPRRATRLPGCATRRATGSRSTPHRSPCRSSPAVAHDGDDLLGPRRIGWIAPSPLRGGGRRDIPACSRASETSGRVQQQLRHVASSDSRKARKPHSGYRHLDATATRP